jgi:serine/threonine-protein kinase
MNALSFGRRLVAFFFLAGFFTASPVLSAEPTENSAQLSSAVNSAQAWLGQIDAGKYDDSYAEGCVAFHNKVTHEEWLTVLKALRPSLGSVVSRKLANHVYHPDGFQGLEGECMVLTYNTVFSKMPADIETIVLKREGGRWRGAGYNAQPMAVPPADADSPPPADAQTEVHQQSAH